MPRLILLLLSVYFVCSVVKAAAEGRLLDNLDDLQWLEAQWTAYSAAK